MNCKSLHSWFSMSPVGTSKVAKIELWMSQPDVAKQTHAYLHVLSCFPGATPALRQALQTLLEAWQSVASSQCRKHGADLQAAIAVIAKGEDAPQIAYMTYGTQVPAVKTP